MTEYRDHRGRRFAIITSWLFVIWPSLSMSPTDGMHELVIPGNSQCLGDSSELTI